MAQRSVEELVKDIETLRAELAVAKNEAKASEAIVLLAKSLGIKCSGAKKSKEYYETILDQIIAVTTKKLSDEIEAFEARLEDETRAANEQMEAKERLAEFADSLADEVRVADAKYAEYERLIARLQASLTAATKENTQLVDTTSDLLLEKERLEIENSGLVEGVAEIERRRRRTEDENARLVDTVAELSLESENLHRQVDELNRANEGLEYDLAATRRDAATTTATLETERDHARGLSISNIYAEVEAMIADVFIKHGYQVSPHAATSDNTQERDRQRELYKAVCKAQSLDKKAVRAAKGGEVQYPEHGYTRILEELIKNYTAIIAKHRETHPELVDEFIATHVTDEAKQDGVVTDEEMLKIILEKEQSKGFLKTPLGKILLSCASVILVAILGAAVFFGVGKSQAETQLNETKQSMSETMQDYETEKQEHEDTKVELEEERKEHDQTKEELEDVKSSYMTGDVVTVTVSADDFNRYKTILKPLMGGVARGILSCQYNKATGDVDLYVACVNNRKQEVTDHIEFAIPMGNISQEVKDGTEVLDFSTIIDCLKSVNHTRKSYSLLDPQILASYDVKQRSEHTTITCSIMIVSVDENGKTTYTMPYEKTKTFVGEIDIEEEKQNVYEAALKDLGIEVEYQI